MVRSFSSKPRSARKEAGREKASRKRESIFDLSKTGSQSGPLFCWDSKKTIHRCSQRDMVRSFLSNHLLLLLIYAIIT
jgi:hypothetical protein